MMSGTSTDRERRRTGEGDDGRDRDDRSSPFDAQAFLRTVTSRPGVYRMFDATGTIIYVGKAANLRNRLTSYFRKSLDNRKTEALVAQIAAIQTTVTGSATEALILEQNLIKEHRPRYNVVLRDDKSYPCIFISTRDEYPRVTYQRGARKAKGKYIGPYPSAAAVKRSLRLVQKLFKVRQCEDSYFRNRSRPCLQYQIQRCTAPCVGLISPEDYRRDVDNTVRVLDGQSREVVAELAERMDAASEALEFETAARLRDQIADLQALGDLNPMLSESSNADYVAAASGGGQSCVQVFFIRNGLNLGNRAFYPTTPSGSTSAEILEAFLAQYYLEHDLPREIIVAEAIAEPALLEDVFSERLGARVSIVHRVRAERARLQQLAQENADIALATRLASRQGQAARLDALRELAELAELPSRMECFDISHTMGEATVASCVVFNAEGPLKSDYRRFNIENITPGDDYAAMHQALLRRYTRLVKEQRELPDILFIDGGKGQVAMAREVLAELQIDGIQLIGVSKGPDRRPGDETLLLVRDAAEESAAGDRVLQLGSDSPALLLVQQIRDEAHRFAITGHRGRRARARQRSVLEDIPGLGPKRRKALLLHFGGIQGVRRASVQDIANVPGISEALAGRIHAELHP